MSMQLTVVPKKLTLKECGLTRAQVASAAFPARVTLRIFYKVTSVAIVDEDTHILDHATSWGVHKVDIAKENADLLPVLLTKYTEIL